MNIIYVTRLLTWTGLEHDGRSLVRHLSAEHNLRLCGGIVNDDSSILEGHLARYVVRPSELADADVVYMEGGWNRSDGSPDRFPLELASEFVGRGGQLIVADIDRNVAKDDAEVLESSRSLLGTVPSPSERGVQYLDAGDVRDVGGAQRFVPGRMRIDESWERAWDGIDSVLVDGTIVLSPLGEILASGHADTSILVNDLFYAGGAFWPWAMVRSHLAGHVVIIGACVSGDFFVDACPDNARWISNLMGVLLDRTAENRAWRGKRLHKPSNQFNVLRFLDEEEGPRHERKASFLTPTDLQRPDTSKKTMQEAVGKSIAALANTDGGAVVIGQADDGSILGLEADFKASGKHANKDGFEQVLVRYVEQNIWPSWEAIQLSLSWAEKDGKSVAILQVPSCARAVHVNYGPNKEAVFVRRGNTSVRLEGRDLTEWLGGPRFTT